MINVNQTEDLVFQPSQKINQNNESLPQLSAEAKQGSTEISSYVPESRSSLQESQKENLLSIPLESQKKDGIFSSNTQNFLMKEAPSLRPPGKGDSIQTFKETALEKDYDSLFQAFTNETPESPSGLSLRTTNPREFSEINKISPNTVSESDRNGSRIPDQSFAAETPKSAGTGIEKNTHTGKERSPHPFIKKAIEPISLSRESVTKTAGKNNEYLLKTFAAGAPEALPQSDLSQNKRDGLGSSQASKNKLKEKSDTKLASPQTTTKKSTRSSSRSKTKTLQPSSKPSTTTSSEKITLQLSAESQVAKSSEKLISKPSEQAVPELETPTQTSVAEAVEKGDYESLAKAFDAEAPGTLRFSLPKDQMEAPDAVQASKTITKETLETEVTSPQTTTKKATRSSSRPKTRAPKASSSTSAATSPEATLKLEAESQGLTGSKDLVSQPSEKAVIESSTPSSQTTFINTAEKDFGSLTEASDAARASQTISKGTIETEVASPQTTTKKATRDSSLPKTRTQKPSSKISTTASSESTSKPVETDIQGLTDS
ncbi:hypothetical protein DSO57_1038000 [Entomophthora muscae]|uniref:Uncharacterized protein n=1 Tax=Entomophthora muscae TaxID=34485 RepID=A0ACC2UKG5_9FUNG|nr:hypothetical protein DSO57_1038000 [Entomophthora muscae]